MTKKRNKCITYVTVTLAALQDRAEQRCGEMGHRLGYWQPAKRKKHGLGSMFSLCTICGMFVVVKPAHTHQGEQIPAMRGEALFDKCARKIYDVN